MQQKHTFYFFQNLTLVRKNKLIRLLESIITIIINIKSDLKQVVFSATGNQMIFVTFYFFLNVLLILIKHV